MSLPRNSLKIAFRYFRQNRLYVTINIAGLAIGITCVILSILYGLDEQSFDQFHDKRSAIYRLTTTITQTRGGQAETNGGTGQVQGPAFKARIPEVQDYVRVMGGDIYGNLTTGNKSLNLQLLFVDAAFLNVFSFKLLRGNPDLALQGTRTIVITERTARKFFNSLDVIGRTLQEDGPSGRRVGASVITGVVQDPPRNSSIQFDALLPFRFMQASFDDTNWLNTYLSTFVLLHPQADRLAVHHKLNQVYAALARNQLTEHRKNYGFDPLIQYTLQPLTDLHLNPLYVSQGNREGGVINGSNPIFSYLFLGISVFILLMASVNFINIGLATSLKRAKEVGIRKVAGSSRRQIMLQFLSESGLQCITAFGLALFLTGLIMPTFNQLADKGIQIANLLNGNVLLSFGLLLAINVILAGLYPSVVLSNLKPTAILYQKQSGPGRNRLGRWLVVFQFALAFFLIVSSIVFYSQMNFIRTKDLGYNPGPVIRTHIAGAEELLPIQRFLRRELSHEASIRQVSFGSELGGTYETQLENRSIQCYYQYIDEHYLPTLGIQVKAGRNIAASFPTDSTTAVLVNESFVKTANLSNPVGKQIRLNQSMGSESRTIVGVINDFHRGSLREPIQPLVLFMRNDQAAGMWVKIDKSRQQEALSVLAKVYHKALPKAEYQYQFLDELNAREYKMEYQWQQLIGYATGLAVLICSLGLFGLAQLSAQQRTKEIGIRKVLGATVWGAMALLSKDFLKLVVIGIVIASPLSAWAMNHWLQRFAYRINLEWWMFTLTGLLATVLAFVTISIQTSKVARMNPVNSLKYE